MQPHLLAFVLLTACTKAPPVAPEVPQAPVAEPTVEMVAGDCHDAKNVCPDYAPSWVEACPEGSRCLTFKNSCTTPVAIAYQVGCNGDGTKGAPQCDCSDGPIIAPGTSTYWVIVDGNYESCLPSWQPACLTAGLAIMANPETASCTQGSRVEFSAGNQGDPFGHFDSYNLDIEKGWYAVPVTFRPDIECANDHGAHDCREVWCNSDTCPDAYSDPTAGGCSDGRSPQVGCQDTFSGPHGLTVEFCPAACVAGEECPECLDAKACP